MLDQCIQKIAVHPLVDNMPGRLDYLPVNALQLLLHAKGMADAWTLARLDQVH